MLAMQLGQTMDDALAGAAEVRVADLFDVPTAAALRALAAGGDDAAARRPESTLTVFVTACFGRGEPTDGAKKFFAAVMDPASDGSWLAGARFAVFGLGSSQVRRIRGGPPRLPPLTLRPPAHAPSSTPPRTPPRTRARSPASLPP